MSSHILATSMATDTQGEISPPFPTLQIDTSYSDTSRVEEAEIFGLKKMVFLPAGTSCVTNTGNGIFCFVLIPTVSI